MGLSIARSIMNTGDGQGYPDGLAGRKNTVGCPHYVYSRRLRCPRSERCYKPAVNHEDSVISLLPQRHTVRSHNRSGIQRC
jgi:hypothetical protein